MTRVFASYRRTDTAQAAAGLHDCLVRHLRRPEIFMDVASMAPADDWMRQVEEAVRTADWCLVLIGRRWLERTPSGQLRLDDRADVVRFEVSTAITQGIPTLPITVDGAPMPSGEELPLAVARLVRFQGETLSTARLDADVQRISAVIKKKRKGSRRASIPVELTGFWAHTTAQTGSSYEFFIDGTYVYSGILNQTRPDGQSTFEFFEEGIVDIDAHRADVLRLQPLRASANRKDSGDPGSDYANSRRELTDKTLTWRLLGAAPPTLMLAVPGQPEAAYDLEWRG